MKIVCSVVSALMLCTLVALPRSASAQLSWRRAPEGTFVIRSAVLARRVEDRKPVEPCFAAPQDGERLYLYLDAFNKGPQRNLTVVWKRGAREFHRVTLRVGTSPSWRTWAFLTLKKFTRGAWTVEVHDAGGDLLLGLPFLVGDFPS